MIAAFLLAAVVANSADDTAKSSLSQDITVKSRAAGATGVQVAPPTASKPVIDEVLRSLSLGRGAVAPALERIRVVGENARLAKPFPKQPFLALSPANIAAVYDEWVFEVLDNEGDIVWKSDGVGSLQEKLYWDGTGPDSRLCLIAGRSYHYRFTGRRAGRAFIIESEPVALKSFTYHEYAGETRLEADLALFFAEGKAVLAKDGGPWLEALAGRLRQGEPRADGNYKVEFYAKNLRSKTTLSRVKALSLRLSKVLLVAPERVVVSLIFATRGEAVAAFLPPAKGGALQIE